MELGKIFTNTNVFYLCLLIVLILLAPNLEQNLQGKQLDWNNRFDKAQKMDIDKCPYYSGYFANFQASYTTYPFGMISATVTGIFAIIVFYGITLINPNIKLKDVVLVIVFFAIMTGFITGYKVSNCMLGRMCGRAGWCLGDYPYAPSPS